MQIKLFRAWFSLSLILVVLGSDQAYALALPIEVKIIDAFSEASARQRHHHLYQLTLEQLKFWHERGASLRPGTLPIFVEPKEDTSISQYISALMHSGWQDTFRKVSDAISLQNPEPINLFQILSHLDGAFSPLFSGDFKSKEILEVLSRAERSQLSEKLKNRLDRALAHPEKPVWWRARGLAAAYYEYRGLDSLGLVSLNRSTHPAELNSWEYDEVITHEVGHLLHYLQWESGEAFPNDFGLQDTTTNELIADFFAHIFLESDGCHRRRLNTRPGTNECSRRMNSNPNYPDLQSEIMDSSSGHEGGELARAFLWDSYQRLGREKFSEGFVAAVRALGTFLRQKPFHGFTSSEVFFDPFLRPISADLWQFQVLTKLLQSYCSATAELNCEKLPQITVDRGMEKKLKAAIDSSPIRTSKRQQEVPFYFQNEQWALSFLFKPRTQSEPPELRIKVRHPSGASYETRTYIAEISYRRPSCMTVDFASASLSVTYCDDGQVRAVRITENKPGRP